MRYEVARALDQVQKAHARMNAGNRARQKLYHRPSRQRPLVSSLHPVRLPKADVY